MASERDMDLTTFRGRPVSLPLHALRLVNAMAVWSRFIDTVMEKYRFKFVLCYADDCLVFTKADSVDDHIRDVEKVFDELHANGIKVKASKLKLGLREIPHLGVILRQDGITPNPEK